MFCALMLLTYQTAAEWCVFGVGVLDTSLNWGVLLRVFIDMLKYDD